MRVTALHTIKSGGRYHAPGETFDVSDDEAAGLRKAGAITGDEQAAADPGQGETAKRAKKAA